MTRYLFESFAGFRLLVHTNDLHDEGMVLSVKYTHDGTVITFTTETGDHSFYYKGEKSATELTDGWWKFPRDFQHWAYAINRRSAA